MLTNTNNFVFRRLTRGDPVRDLSSMRTRPEFRILRVLTPSNTHLASFFGTASISRSPPRLLCTVPFSFIFSESSSSSRMQLVFLGRLPLTGLANAIQRVFAYSMTHHVAPIRCLSQCVHLRTAANNTQDSAMLLHLQWLNCKPFDKQLGMFRDNSHPT